MLLVPKLDILPEAQKQLWPQLKDTPKEFVLYGGTAIALRYGHRQSVDFDFFTTRDIDLLNITKEIPYIKKFAADYKRHSNDFIDYFLETTVNHSDKVVKVSFVKSQAELPMPACVTPPDTALGNSIKIASPLDLMAGKIFALYDRTARKDIIDIGAFVVNGVSLQKGFETACAIGKHMKIEVSAQTYLGHPINILRDKQILSRALSEYPGYAERVLSASATIDIKRVLATKLKAQPCLDAQKSLEL